MEKHFTSFLMIMSIIAVFVFIALFFITAGYGQFTKKNWGMAINNKLGWILMEAPVFIVMLILWLNSDRTANISTTIILLLFELHYFQRSFIFPFLLKGKGKMPFSIILMGVIFNVSNALMQGGWLFYFAPEQMYTNNWLLSSKFIIGTIIFLTGMAINIHSDSIIRNLRKPGDSAHYLPQKGMYKYVSSANYFGEIIEWIGFAILTWSTAGAVFALWTFANLVPRAAKIHSKYKVEFAEQMKNKNIKIIFPYIY